MALRFTRRYLLALPLAIALAALFIGIPTDVLPNPWFTRMTPVRTFDLVLWPLTSVAVGALLATFALPSSRRGRPEMAVGCPVCNKLVVLVLGFSGALTYFASVQPWLGAGALLLTLVALRRRLSALTGACVARPVASGPAGRYFHGSVTEPLQIGPNVLTS